MGLCRVHLFTRHWPIFQNFCSSDAKFRVLRVYSLVSPLGHFANRTLEGGEKHGEQENLPQRRPLPRSWLLEHGGKTKVFGFIGWLEPLLCEGTGRFGKERPSCCNKLVSVTTRKP